MHVLENFHLGCPEKQTGADDRRHALQEKRGLADFLDLDDVISRATQRWFSPFSQPVTQLAP